MLRPRLDLRALVRPLMRRGQQGTATHGARLSGHQRGTTHGFLRSLFCPGGCRSVESGSSRVRRQLHEMASRPRLRTSSFVVFPHLTRCPIILKSRLRSVSGPSSEGKRSRCEDRSSTIWGKITVRGGERSAGPPQMKRDRVTGLGQFLTGARPLIPSGGGAASISYSGCGFVSFIVKPSVVAASHLDGRPR